MNKNIFALGPKGTFSDLVASKLDPKGQCNISYTHNLPVISKMVEQDATALGVLPIENSVIGIISAAQTSLQLHQVRVIRQIEIPVLFAMVSTVKLGQVECLYAHPMAFEQCTNFIAEHLPTAEVVYTESNIYAGKTLLSHANQKCAALIPQMHAEENTAYKNLHQATRVQDAPDNRTRFFVIQKSTQNQPFNFELKKTSIVVQTRQDRPALLFDILREFHTFEINLCLLNSRPSVEQAWCYDFFIDFYNNQYTQKCLQAITERKIDFKILGSYDLI